MPWVMRVIDRASLPHRNVVTVHSGDIYILHIL